MKSEGRKATPSSLLTPMAGRRPTFVVVMRTERSCPLAAAALWRTGPEPHMGSIVELAWSVGVVGELALPLVCCAVALRREISSPPFCPQRQWQVGELALKGVMRS